MPPLLFNLNNVELTRNGTIETHGLLRENKAQNDK
jgi:hypothetical protein